MGSKANKWLDDIVVTEEMREHSRNFVKLTNEFLGSNFTTSDSLYDILEALSKKWHELS